MNILFLSNSPNVGGGNQSLLLLQKGLIQHGINAEVVVPGEGQMAEACRRHDVPFQLHSYHQPSWHRPNATWREYREWIRVLAKTRPCLIHANDAMTARSVALAAKWFGIPTVCHVRFAPGGKMIEWAYRMLPKPKAFIFNSHAMQAECGEYIRKACPHSGQFVVHNAVDLQQFVPRDKQSVQRRVGILANLIPIKGHYDFLDMAKILSERRLDLEYWLIGDDIHTTGFRSALEQRASALGLDKSVRFLGHRSDVPALLSELDVLVCASHVEPFGRCLVEAMACEKPVVATRVGGIPEVVEDGVTGMLVPPHSPGDLADAVERLIRDPELGTQFGRAGRRRAVEHFSADSHVERVLELYGELLQANGKRDHGAEASMRKPKVL